MFSKRKDLPMLKKQYRVRNWKEYNESLVKRGSITFWFDEKTIQKWHQKQKSNGRGRPIVYGDMAIECGLTLKFIFNLSLRATEGFIKSLIQMMKLPLKTPDYTTLCKRQGQLKIELSQMRKIKGEKIDIVIDSTGLKLFGEGEWQIRQHGKTRIRNWRKVHLAVNPNTHEIEASCLTPHNIQDCQGLPLLLDEIKVEVNKVIGDGAYDRFSCYEQMERRRYVGIFPPQRNASTSEEHKKYKKGISETAILKRDEMVKKVRRWGRKQWKKKCGYHKRSLAETAMFRFKKILGSRLSSRILEKQQVEIMIKSNILNKITGLGMPRSYTC